MKAHILHCSTFMMDLCFDMSVNAEHINLLCSAISALEQLNISYDEK